VKKRGRSVSYANANGKQKGGGDFLGTKEGTYSRQQVLPMEGRRRPSVTEGKRVIIIPRRTEERWIFMTFFFRKRHDGGVQQAGREMYGPRVMHGTRVAWGCEN